MVIVFGTKVKRHPIGFFKSPCAACGAVTDHLRIWEKRAGHVYWIPIIPLGSKRYVLCGGCGTVKPDYPQLDDVPLGGIFGMPAPGAPPIPEWTPPPVRR